MKRVAIILMIVSSSAIALAQKVLPIHEDLDRNGIKMKVKMNVQAVDKLYRLKFGEYAVTNSKVGQTNTTEKGNLFDTKNQRETKSKFSFRLNNATNDVAHVRAEKNIFSRQVNAFEVTPHFSIGDSELLERQSHFAASMHVNDDTASSWKLILQETTGKEVLNDTTGILTNGRRNIAVTWISSNQNGETKVLPALGYAFNEEGIPLSAVQYSGGGMFGPTKTIVWLHPGNDNTTKLILAAAMTAILQTKLTEIVPD